MIKYDILARTRLLLTLLILVPLLSSAQPFIEEIRAFKKLDSIQAPPQKANLFVGSSSLRMWKEMVKDFPDHKVLNRGFGGSTLPDVIRYIDDIIRPYKPKQVSKRRFIQ